ALKRVTGAVPSNSEAWRLLGEASAGDNDWKGSLKAYEHAVKLSPDDVAAHAGLGTALARLKDPKAQGELDWLNAKAQACAGSCADASALKAGADQVLGAMSGGEAPKPSAARDAPPIFARAAARDLAYSTAATP